VAAHAKQLPPRHLAQLLWAVSHLASPSPCL
jgi:hypothetical protein